MICMQGIGAQQARLEVEVFPRHPEDDIPMFVSPSGLSLRLVRSYKHMGAILANTQGPEAMYRVSTARPISATVRRRVFEDPTLPLEIKSSTAMATVNSRLLHLAGLWHALTSSHEKKLQAEMAKPFRGEAKKRGLGEWPSDAAVLSVARRPEFSACLVAARLRMFRRMLKAPRPVRALYQSVGGMWWREEVVRSIDALRCILPQRLSETPSPFEQPRFWECFFR